MLKLAIREGLWAKTPKRALVVVRARNAVEDTTYLVKRQQRLLESRQGGVQCLAVDLINADEQAKEQRHRMPV